MECREYRNMVMPYIKDELSMKDVRAFLSHIRTCKKCREELEVYFIIETGLDKGNIQADMDFEQSLGEKIRESYVKMHMLHSWEIFRYVWNTLIVLSVILTFCIQMRLWME